MANAASHHSPELGKWYDAAYRLACEGAHIGDLFDFIPDNDLANVEAGKLDTGPFQAQTALDYGIQALLSTIQLASANKLGIALDIAPFQRRLAAIRAEAHTITSDEVNT